MAELEEAEQKEVVKENAGWLLGSFSIFGASLLAAFFSIALIKWFKIPKEYEYFVFTLVWIALAAGPLWLCGCYIGKRLRRQGWKGGLWIALPITIFMVVLIPFGNLGMAMERCTIIVVAVGTAIATLATWLSSSKKEHWKQGKKGKYPNPKESIKR